MGRGTFLVALTIVFHYINIFGDHPHIAWSPFQLIHICNKSFINKKAIAHVRASEQNDYITCDWPLTKFTATLRHKNWLHNRLYIYLSRTFWLGHDLSFGIVVVCQECSLILWPLSWFSIYQANNKKYSNSSVKVENAQIHAYPHTHMHTNSHTCQHKHLFLEYIFALLPFMALLVQFDIGNWPTCRQFVLL